MSEEPNANLDPLFRDRDTNAVAESEARLLARFPKWRKKRWRQQNANASSVKMRNRRNCTAAFSKIVDRKLSEVMGAALDLKKLQLF